MKTEEKTALRKEMKILRARISQAERETAQNAVAERLETIPAFCRAKSVFCYLSFGSELPTGRILERCEELGKEIYVPYLLGKEMTAVRFSMPLRYNRFGVPEPVYPKEAEGPIDFAVTPALACDKAGGRLGFGGGYYDAFFSKNNIFRAAVLFEGQLLEELPVESHDFRMDAVITPHEVLYFSGQQR